MSSLRYNFDERSGGASSDGKWVSFDQYRMLSNSNTKGWALAKSLQAQVDILEATVRRAALTGMPLSQDAFPFLQDIVTDAHDALQKLKEHRES